MNDQFHQEAQTSRRMWRWAGALLWIGVSAALLSLWLMRPRDEIAAQTELEQGAAESENEAEPKSVRLKLGADGVLRVDEDALADGPTWDPAGVEDFTFINCDGRPIGKEDLLGKPWIAGFVFTRCTSTCPMITQKMREVQDRLKREDVQLVTFGVDPDRDSSEVLRKYAEQYGADLSRWYFLWGEAKAVYGLIHRSFQMPVQMPDELTGNYQVIHSNNLMLVDAKGVVQGKYLGTKDEDVSKLVRDVRKMLHPDEVVDEPAVETPNAAPPAIAAEAPPEPDWYTKLPAINAALNALAAALLALGYVLIKQRRVVAHRKVMLTAFGVSIVFLGCYLVYHQALYHYTGTHGKQFAGTGPIKTIYFTILITHVILAVTVPVLALGTIYLGLKSDWARHRRIAKITYPIWMYVSVTGVVIYAMLYHWPV